MKVILILFRSSPWRFLIATVVSFISGSALAAVIYILNQAIKTKMADPEVLIAQFLSVLIVYVATGISGAYLITLLGQTAIQNMRLTLSNKILEASFHKL